MQLLTKIGATSFVKLTPSGVCALKAEAATNTVGARARTVVRFITCLLIGAW